MNDSINNSSFSSLLFNIEKSIFHFYNREALKIIFYSFHFNDRNSNNRLYNIKFYVIDVLKQERKFRKEKYK